MTDHNTRHPAAKPDTLVNGGALQLALMALRRSGKDEIAHELEITAVRDPNTRQDVPKDALIQARDMLEHWSSYVPTYFAEKHGLKDDFAALDKWIAAAPEAPAQASQPTQGDAPKINLSTFAWGVSRMGDNPKAVLVSFRSEPTDDDLRRLHEALRPAAGRIVRADAATNEAEQASPPTQGDALNPAVGGRYNWKGQPERLAYMGSYRYPGDPRTWHQFELVDKPGAVWCEVLASDLKSFEVTPPATNEAEQAGEREAFEDWVFDCERQQPMTWDKECAKFGQETPEHKRGMYYFNWHQRMWEAWQARAALQRTESRTSPEQLPATTEQREPKKRQHFDDECVDKFAQAMKDKLAAARAKGRSGWQGCSPEELSRMLREHVEKGDPRDVANFCMFLWNLRTGITKKEG